MKSHLRYFVGEIVFGKTRYKLVALQRILRAFGIFLACFVVVINSFALSGDRLLLFWKIRLLKNLGKNEIQVFLWYGPMYLGLR